jgi:two-component system chemotaxis response regulator CheB
MTPARPLRPVRVVVVDDSAFARKVMREVLTGDPRIEVVAIARDGLDALEKITETSPDVVTLDLVMPQLDGVGVLDAIRMLPNPPRVVVVTMSDADSVLGVAALQAGAFDVVHKPTALATDRLYELGQELVTKVLLAAEARFGVRSSPIPLVADGPQSVPGPLRFSSARCPRHSPCRSPSSCTCPPDTPMRSPIGSTGNAS